MYVLYHVINVTYVISGLIIRWYKSPGDTSPIVSGLHVFHGKAQGKAFFAFSLGTLVALISAFIHNFDIYVGLDTY